MVKKLAGTGELGDMLSHRINFAQYLVGPMRRLVANVKNLTPVRGGLPNDTEDWVAILADFQNGATACWKARSSRADATSLGARSTMWN